MTPQPSAARNSCSASAAGSISSVQANSARLAGLLQRAYLRFHRDHTEFWRLLAWTNLWPVATGPAVGGSRRQVIERLETVHRRARELQAVPADLPFDAWLMAMTAGVHFLFANQRTVSANQVEGPARRVARLSGLIRGRRKTPPPTPSSVTQGSARGADQFIRAGARDN